MMKIQGAMLPGSGRIKAISKVIGLFLVSPFLGLIIQHAAAKVLVIECEDNTEIQINELNPESSYGYLFGDQIEVRLNHLQKDKTGIYQLSAASTANSRGYWVYNSPRKPSFSLSLPGKSNIWYLKFKDKKSLTCDRFVD